MAVIKPFKALRFTERAGSLKSLTCPPYDIISEAKRDGFLGANPNNIIRLELPRCGEDPYRKAGETLREWISNGVLKQDEADALYIYEEEFSAEGKIHKVKGMTCRVKLEEFSAGVVLPHEETLSKAKTDRFNLLKAAKANLSSIYSLYFDGNNQVYSIIDLLSARTPDAEVTDEDQVTHRLWVVSDNDKISEIEALMADKKIYIADGHHRYETALNYRKYLKEQGKIVDGSHPADYIMMHLVNMENNGLVVLPTHRIIKNLEQFDQEKLLSACEKYFEIEDCENPEQELERCFKENQKAFVMYAKNAAKRLVLKDISVMKTLLPEKSQAYRELDVTVLHTLVLERILGIDKENMAGGKNLIYTRDTEEAISEVDHGGADCAFLINPTKVPEIAAVAGASEKMPQKSTYFYPKLITGLMINPVFER